MSVRLIKQRSMNLVVSHLGEVDRALKKQARKTAKIADQRLESARASTQWYKIADPDDQTEISVSKGDVDYWVNMDGYKDGARALEYGHAPSGIFGPEGRLGHIKTKAPMGLYILTGAYIQS